MKTFKTLGEKMADKKEGLKEKFGSARLVNDISLEDKTDSTETKMFNPKNVFEASDYMIDRLALLFERERQDLKKAS